MDKTTAERIAKRFVGLPVEQRRQILAKMAETGQSFRLLPIAVTRHEVKRIPLSYAQQRMLFLWQLEPLDSAYNVPMAVRLSGHLDQAALATALERLVQRHEALRTRFVSEEGEFHQEILEQAPVALQVSEIAPGSDAEARLREQVEAELRAPFDLLDGALLRVRLFRLGEQEHVLTLCMHHIVSDGWSGQVLVGEFVQFYQAAVAGQAAQLPALPIQYADYAIWQRSWLEAGEAERQLAYWKEQLGEEQPLLALPLDHERPPQASQRGAVVRAELPAELSGTLKRLARNNGQTLFMLTLAALAVVLSRYSGQADIRIGAPNAGRTRAELEGLIGFFINTQVLRIQVDERQTFAELLQQVKQVVAGAQSHQELPFEHLVEALAPERSLGHNPLFQFKINQHVNDDSEDASQDLAGLTLADYPLGGADARFDLAFDFSDTPNGVRGYFTYATDLFEASTIERIAASLREVLEALAAHTDARLLDHPQGVVARVETPAASFPANDFLALWRQGLAAGRGKPALRAGDEVLDYDGLERQSNQLAHYLKAQGIGAGMTVALCQERGIEWVTGLLAVLKLGAVYLPLDTKQPAERLQQLLRDSAAALLIHAAGDDKATGLGVCPALAWDAALWNEASTDAPALDLLAQQPAYIIYTSGSTGQPKGVVISHGALASYVQGVSQRLQLSDGASMAMVSTIAADLGHTLLFGALAEGRQLHLLSHEHAFDPDRFAAYMAEHRVEVLKIVPSHLQGLLQAARAADVLPGELLILGGEASSWSLVEQIRALKPGCRILNHYGPTETTVGILTHEVQDVLPGCRTVPVGTPLANAEAEVLDAWLNPLAERVAGELYLGGQGLAQGYLGQPALTAERFVPAAGGQRRYRAGDRARHVDGRLEYLGRADDQVKIRGYRVEPGEVGQILRALPGVAEAVVLALPLDSDESRLQLVGYCVAAGGTTLQVEALRQQLAASLPEYLVPAQILLLDRLPLTANGKLDKRALPKPGAVKQRYVAPVGEIEEKLAAVWADVLKLEKVGSTDNFFELGGDSILSLQIIARAKRQGIKLNPKQLFEKQTIGQLATVAKLIEKKAAAPVAEQVSGNLPLLPIQARFFDTEIPERHHWNQSVLLKPAIRLDAGHLTAALHALIEQHDALRLTFVRQQSGWQAAYASSYNREVLWTRELADSTQLAALADEAQRSLDLATGPLLRAVLVDLPQGEQRLLLVIHHLVVDGVSWRVLLEDLQQACRALHAGQALNLPPRSSSLKAWAERLHGYAGSAALEQELGWWQAQLQGVDDRLPCDNPAGAQQNRHAVSVSSRLDAELTRKLLQEAPAAYRTQINDLLLTALAGVVSRWTGQPDVLIRLEGHGREDLFDDLDLSRTVGWFSSLFPVRLTPRADLAESIMGIKEQLRAIPDKGIGYGVLRHLGSDAARQSLGQLAQGNIVFNYLGQFDGSFAEQDALFVPSGESSGAGQSAAAPLAALLSIDGQVYGGELALNWSFSGEVFRRDTVQRLADDFTRALAELVRHCADSGARGVTPSDFPLARLTQEQLQRLPLPAADIQDVYPLSPMQEGLLLHTLREPGSGIYLMQYCYLIEHAIDLNAFEQAWRTVVERHEVLRTSFCWDVAEQMVQIIRREPRPDIRLLDWQHVAPDQYEALLEAELSAELRQGFDLANEVAFRLRLIKLGEQRYGFVLSNHHILLDAWCRMGLVAEFFELYSAQLEGRPSTLAAATSYRDFIAWLQSRDQQVSKDFWQAQLAGFERPTALPFDHTGQRDSESAVGDCLVRLTLEQSQRLAQAAQGAQLTLNTLVQAAWAILLHRYSGERDVLFGVTVAGRPADIPEMQTTVGLFINSIPLRVRVPGAESRLTLKAWLQDLLVNNVALREHEHVPLVNIQQYSEIGKGQALFDSLFVFENAPVEDSVYEQADDMKIQGDSSRTHTNYPLTVVIYPGSVLGLHLSYDKRFFAKATVDTLLEDFRAILLSFASGMDQDFHQLSCLGGEVATLAQEPVPAEFSQGYARLFERSAARFAERTAARHLQQQWNYTELDQQAHRLAQALQGHGVQADDLVAVLGERGLPLLGMVVGSFKAGAGYLGLDPNLPLERLAGILQSSASRLLVASESSLGQARQVLERIPEALRPQLLVWEQIQQQAAPLADLAERPADASQHLAYVIFTSGSTGTPKGVMVQQAGMLNNQLSKLPYLKLDEHDVIAQTASQSFDISVWQLLTAALCGAVVEIVPSTVVQDPRALIRHVQDTGITVLEIVPALVQGILDLPQAELPSLRYLMTTGEAMPPALAERWLRQYPRIPLINAYGPAECSDDVALHPVVASDGQGICLPIGTATAHNRLHVLNDLLEPMPLRATGELHIAGVGVGRGYLADPKRTALAFVPNPYASVPGERLYRTGDLVRQRAADGVLEYVGRTDYQVKIRGYRIELGEIEVRLLEHPDVREAVVVDIDGPGGKQLAAYLVPAGAAPATADERNALRGQVKAHLKAHLPDYMVPAHLILLDGMPLTANGKLDRKALPAPQASELQQHHVPPVSATEQQLAAIWADVLKVERVGLGDNFFELGGHSLLVVQVMVRVRERLSIEMSLNELFEHPELGDFARAVEKKNGQGEQVQDELAKSLEALKRLSAEEIDNLIA
ncbi:non-ribosomal peptide synthetase [Pseudomonas japonica]|uniref:Non-ribosomal peptide synthase domain TIGR01720/amino acid adenylation domain-containing protein n=1 Tax=Pseudomonas japonica TaxID=256466 RepID=A0A239LJQ7_9PSED|nr:non-ribosomal peptide synthetase [Pseudomonas japonica]SNT30917.1 non-ribosomal peptide synthase domain TIGR01720/amino acid adenylation domain-containing protein [Pseudomonas japonica]